MESQSAALALRDSTALLELEHLSLAHLAPMEQQPCFKVRLSAQHVRLESTATKVD